MDGLPDTFDISRSTTQQTLRSAIDCVGVGLHSGRRINLKLSPAPADHGVVFRRIDLGVDIEARFNCVAGTRLCTLLASPERPDALVGTVEHLMAALAGCGVDNVLVELDGPEVPILDGSAESFVFLLECAGIVAQAAPRAAIEVLRRVRVEDGEAFVELRPFQLGFDMAFSIDFAASAIGRQALSLRLTPASFRAELARARTFTEVHEVDALHGAGLARGGSLDNAIVVDGDRVLNPAGLRMPDEFVRHKLLDAVGDLALAGAPLRARFVAHRSGHKLNNELLRTLLADNSAWRMAAPTELLSAAA
jgi:UDP-3-O-[3-hydroxymyristoyl] N-acetylglucosamine deacetylase